MSLTDQVPDGNVNDVLKWAGNDPEKINAALEAEREREGGQRKSLTAALEDRQRAAKGDTVHDVRNLGNIREGDQAPGSAVGQSNPPANFAAAANADEFNVQREPGSDVDPNAEVQSNTGAPGVVGDDGHDDAKLCQEHFPRGWDSPACHMVNNPEHLYPRVFCEHAPEGGYIRPVGR